MGAEVHFECQRALVDLCKSVGGVQNVIARKELLPETDYCVPLLSLPHLMGTTLETVPADLPYLAANRSKSRAFVKQLQSEKINVGLVWLGNPERRDDVMRSCPAEALEPILSVDGLQFLSLQVGLARDDIPETTVDLGSDCADFADTAAAINAMDLVITVDTATAHLAGALESRMGNVGPPRGLALPASRADSLVSYYVPVSPRHTWRLKDDGGRRQPSECIPRW